MRKSQLYSIAFGFSLLVLLSFSILLYNSIESFSSYASRVEHTQTILNNLQKLHSAVIDAETGQRGFLLTKDSTFLDPLLAERVNVPIVLDSLLVLTSDDPLQHANVERLKVIVRERLHALEESFYRSQFIDNDSLTIYLIQGKILMDEFRKNLNATESTERALLAERLEQKTKFERITPTYFKVIISITAIVSFVSFWLLMRELRDRVAAQSLLEKRFHALNRSNEELQQIAHVTSHDLQEPLRKIRTFSDALVIKYKEKVPAEVLAILLRIDANAFRMRQLVSDLSAFAGLSTPEGAIAQVELNDIIEGVKKSMINELEEKNATLVISSLPSIRGYDQQLRMIFRELFINALKFSKQGVNPVITVNSATVSGKVVSLLNEEKHYILISVSDNGIGFETEYANKIFILFQQLNRAPEAMKGRGLGLGLCQRIMANHEGLITAIGNPGEGATFNLYFPV